LKRFIVYAGTGNTILGRMRAAREAGYTVVLRYVALSTVEMNIERVQARVVEGGHWIDPVTIQRRVANSFANLPLAIAIADRATLLDNSGTVHRRVLEVEAGCILYQAPNPPVWLAAQIPSIMAALERPAFQGPGA